MADRVMLRRRAEIPLERLSALDESAAVSSERIWVPAV
jgi:hypothetical protein